MRNNTLLGLLQERRRSPWGHVHGRGKTCIRSRPVFLFNLTTQVFRVSALRFLSLARKNGLVLPEQHPDGFPRALKIVRAPTIY
jgi:hypothetical protein